MRKSWAAVVVLLVAGAGPACAQGTFGRVYYRASFYPVYTVTTVPAYYYTPVLCEPVVFLAPARPVVVVPNLAVPTAAPPSQTKEPPLAPGKADKAPESKSERPPQMGEPRFYPVAARPPVLTGESR
jgi:hypothetical protein